MWLPFSIKGVDISSLNDDDTLWLEHEEQYNDQFSQEGIFSIVSYCDSGAALLLGFRESLPRMNS